MTVDEFLVWTEQQPGRYELVDGVPIRMQSERTLHTRVKLCVVRALADAIAAAGLPCEAWMDGVSIHIDNVSWREPDAAVTCGEPESDDVLALTNPIIVVEVISPSNASTDKTRKLADYARVPSLEHYLIIDPEARIVIHHRLKHAPILTEVLRGGDLVLAPPGLTVPLAAMFPAKRG
jgi:Uma2 family endonuclease